MPTLLHHTHTVLFEINALPLINAPQLFPPQKALSSTKYEVFPPMKQKHIFLLKIFI